MLYKLKGHTDTITGLSLSPDGSYILSNAMDNTLKIWDVRPFAPYERCVKILSGHQHNFEKVFFFSNIKKKNIHAINVSKSIEIITFLESSEMCLVTGWQQSLGWLLGPISLYLGYHKS